MFNDMEMNKRMNRVKIWTLLNNEIFDEPLIDTMLFEIPSLAKNYEKYYFACEKYKEGYFCTDAQKSFKVLQWDTLLGHPFETGALNKIKCKNSIGYFTYNQVKFILYETARTLKNGGIFEITFREYNKLALKKQTLKWRVFNKYLHGRRSSWTREALISLCAEYQLGHHINDDLINGMNLTMWFTREPGNLKRFAPEPKVKK